MYELIQAGANTFYIDCPAKVGIYRTAKEEVWLVDSGNDKDMARRICKHLDAQGWTLAGIVNTHCHADHTGANAALARRTGCRILGAGMENAITRYPVFEPSYLYGGYPMKDLCNKFLMAPESDPDGTMEDLPAGMEAFPLPGHFFEMSGIRTDDGVMFIADSLFPMHTLQKYHVFFLYDVQAFLDTLDWLEGAQASLFIPSHAEATADISLLTKANRDKVYEIANIIKDICREPQNPDEVIKAVFDHYGLDMILNQYVLVGSTVRSYLSYLCDKGDMQFECRQNRLLFTTLQAAK